MKFDRRNMLGLGLLVAGLVVGYVGGVVTVRTGVVQPEQKAMFATQHHASVEPQPQSQVEKISYNSEGGTIHGDQQEVASAGHSSSSDVPAQNYSLTSFEPDTFHDMLLDQDLLRRWAGFSCLVNDLNGAEIGRAMEVMDQFPTVYALDSERELLLHAWAQRDADSALAYVQSLEDFGQRQRGLVQVLSGWATIAPHDAMAWASEFSEVEDSRYKVAVVRGMARQDPHEAARYMEVMPSGPNRLKAAELLVQRFAQDGVGILQDWVSGVEDTGLRKDLVRLAVKEIAPYDTDRAVAWVASLTGHAEQEAAANALAMTWAQKAPEKAIDWAIGLKQDDVKEKAMALVVEGWATSDPVAAGEWLMDHFDHVNLDKSIVRFAYRFQRSDPELAMSWAEAIQDVALRDKTLGNLIQIWSAADPESADQYFESL